MGKNMIFVPECHSTNSLAQQLAQQSSTPDGSVVITDNQTAGRGQRGNTWEALQGLNFTFSILVKPTFLSPTDQFYLNIAVALGIFNYLKQKTDRHVTIKWPNDILIERKKICGILIENTLQGTLIHHSVLGIGLNMNQQSFSNEKATSLKMISGQDYILAFELDELLLHIERQYLLLRQGNSQQLLKSYYEHLFGMGEERKFKTSAEEFYGIITGVDTTGRLKIKTSDGEKLFTMKEIQFVY
jgi:BirA family biotin operon repressor/biotin-[acetyl-CoA-carboxylase] ligase